jgi:hypothetical protein
MHGAVDELIGKLGIKNTSNQGEHVLISCGNEFEPHGRASETWELIWRLSLVKIPHHWYSTKDGWVPGTGKLPMRFEGRSMSECLQKALMFLDEWKAMPCAPSTSEKGST